jgi:1-deoxy-D-xylulose-5-phosphate synthase
MTLPDIFIDHEKPEKQYEIAGLKRADIVFTALSALGKLGEPEIGINPVRA